MEKTTQKADVDYDQGEVDAPQANSNHTSSNNEEGASCKEMAKTLGVYVLIAIAVILLFRFVLMLNYIPSPSMENSIMVGDIVLGTRYDADQIERYDVMVFISPDNNLLYIKRVIGLPGETITVRNGKVYANGEELRSDFIKEEMDTTGDGVYPVPECCYFMLGDNRNESWDSRFWENHYVPAENFIGHAKFVLFPIAHFGEVWSATPWINPGVSVA